MHENETNPNRRSRLIAVGAVAAIAAVAVGSSVVANLDDSNPATLTPNEIAALRSQLDEQLTSASRAQREAMLDGEIDKQDLRTLAGHASICAVDAGGPPIEIEFDGRSFQWTVDFGREAKRAEITASMVDIDRCWLDHVSLAERYYALEAVPDVSDQARLNDAVAACLAAEGIEAKGWPATEARIDPAVEASCVDEAEGL